MPRKVIAEPTRHYFTWYPNKGVKAPIIQENKPFKNREDVKAEIHNCDLFGGICQYASFIFAALGIVGDVLNTTVGLEPISWFLLAIVAGLNAIIGHAHVVAAKHLLGVQTDNTEQE